MTHDRVGRFAGGAIAALTGSMLIVGAAMVLLFVARHPGNLPGQTVAFIFYGVPVDIAFAVVATAILRRLPKHPIGWLFGWLAMFLCFGCMAEGFAAWVLPGTEWVLWTWSILVGPAFFSLAMALLLFPTGRATSRPSRWLATLLWLYLGAAVASSSVAPWPRDDDFIVLWVQDHRGNWPAPNPIGWEAPGWVSDVTALIAPTGIPLFVLSVTSLLPRWRRSTGDERQQIKWLGLAGLVFALEGSLGLIGFLTIGDQKSQPNSLVGTAIWTLAFACIPVAIGIAIARYRLYDIDVLISRAIVYGGLASFIGLGYVLIVAYTGTFVDLWTGSATLVVLAVMAAVAVAFQPVRSALQSGAERLVFGDRAAPYDLMSRFGHELGQTLGASDVLARIAEAAAQATRARFARITATQSDGATVTKTWPPHAEAPARFDMVVPVHHDATVIAEIAVAGGASRSADVALLHNIAAVSSGALRNLRLVADLDALHETILQQNAGIAASKQRLVTAADVERRELERIVAARIEPQLDLLREALAALRCEVETGTDALAVECEHLAAQATELLDEMRSISRGLLPPLLLDYGLAAALRAMMRRVDLDFTFDMAPTLMDPRLPPPIESTVYLCCQTFLDAAAGAGAAAATLRLWRDNGCLAFSVTHDAAMAWSDDETALLDRIATLGGNLATDTAEQWATITVTLPLTDEPGPRPSLPPSARTPTSDERLHRSSRVAFTSPGLPR